MKRIAILATALAVLVLGTGAVMAQPGNAPVDVPAEQPTDGEQQAEHEMNETEQMNETEANASEHAGSQADVAPDAHANNGEQGPPVEMPDPVPDRVAEIHEMIQQFLDGNLDSPLGESLQDVVGDDGEQTQNEHADENATAAQDA